MSSKRVERINVMCVDCEGTGLYLISSENGGVGVVCVGCQGTGKKTIEYTPFSGRIWRSDVATVCIPGVKSLSAGFGPQVTYEEFLAGKLPS